MPKTPQKGGPGPKSPQKIVGFHVEGQLPSPRPSGELDAAERDRQSSPSPVIIPPNFQSQDSRSIDGASPEVVPTTPPPPEGAAPPPPPARQGSGGTLRAGGPPSAMKGAAAAAGAPPPPHAGSAPPAVRFATPLETAATPPPSPFLGGGAPPSPQQPSPPRGPRAPPPPGQQKQPEQTGQQQHQGEKRPGSKELSRAERRAIQEAQRAAKAAAKGGAPPAAATGRDRPGAPGAPAAARPAAGGAPAVEGRGPASGGGGGGERLRRDSSAAAAAAAVALSERDGERPSTPAAPAPGSAGLFSHLPPFRRVTLASLASSSPAAAAAAAALPPQVVRLGLAMADGSVRGANARAAATLACLRDVAAGFSPPPGRPYAKELAPLLNACVAFLVACRPLGAPMGAAIKHVKACLERLKLSHADAGAAATDAARAALTEAVGVYLQERVHFAGEVLARHAAALLADGDVVATYAYSSAVAGCFRAARARGLAVTAVVLDAGPLHEGRRMLAELAAAGVPVEYAHLNGAALALGRATKVLLGAAAVLANGAVQGRAGAAAVALAAAAARVPVIVAAETHKFAERVQLDSITHNELGDPDALLSPGGAEGSVGGAAGAGAAASPLAGWRGRERLGLLHLLYDVTPAECVAVVVTEVGAVPPTSVPVIIREYSRDGGGL